MSIHKKTRSSGKAFSWQVKYREGAKQKSKTFRTRKDAVAFDSKVNIAKRQGVLHELDRGTARLSEFGERWWASPSVTKLAKNTRKTHAYQWNKYVLPYLGEKQLRAINPATIEEWQGLIESEGANPPTVRRTMLVLQSCLQRAVVWQEIRSNPCREIKKPSSKSSRVIKPLSPSVVEEIRQHFIEREDHFSASVVSVLAFAGLRPGEMRGLTWSSVGESTLLIERSVAGTEVKDTKTGRSRPVDLLAPVRRDLLEWQLRVGHRDGPIFQARNGGVWSDNGWKKWQSNKFKPAAQACGLNKEVIAYDLRHSFASLLIHQGMSVVEVAAQLGHSPAMTLSTYTHVFADFVEKRSAEDVIERVRSERFTKRSLATASHVRADRATASESKPTPRFELGTPSLRVKCSTN